MLGSLARCSLRSQNWAAKAAASAVDRIWCSSWEHAGCCECTRLLGLLGGVFTQRGHSTNYYVVYPKNTPENHPPTEACMIHSKQHRDAEFRTLGPVATGGEKQPTLRTARAQRGHSTRTAHGAPPLAGHRVTCTHSAPPERALSRTKGFCGALGKATARWESLYTDIVAAC